MSKAFIIQYTYHDWNRNRKIGHWRWMDLQYGEDENILWLFPSEDIAKIQLKEEEANDDRAMVYHGGHHERPMYRVTEVTWDISEQKKGYGDD